MKQITLLIALFLSLMTFGQKKYAVIICPYSPDTKYEEPNSWADVNPITGQYYEFWNDTYLVWETLMNHGFDNSNIFLLYNEGDDYPENFPNYNNRYKAINHNLNKITDYEAYKEKVDLVFNGFANGTGGFDKLTENDFLVLYILGHGSPTGITLAPFPPLNPKSSLLWTELSTYLSNINCEKKLIVMHQCFSGSSIPYLEDNNTVIMTAVDGNMLAFECDNLYFDDISYPGDPNPGNQYTAYETETYPSDPIIYRHAEFNLHFLDAVNGIDPAGANDFYQTGYGNFPFGNADNNNDSFISMTETFNWIVTFDSQMRKQPSFTNWDDPQLSDLGNIASQTSLEYPTLLSTNIPAASNITHRGLIGISKDIHVPQGSKLTIHDNAVLHLVNEANLIVDQGATLIIGDNVTITGANSNNELIVEGILTIGENVVFNSQNNASWKVSLKNESQNLTLLNTEFSNCSVGSWCNTLSLSNGMIKDCKSFTSHRGTITISNTDILKTEIYLENEDDNDNYISLTDNDFSDGTDKTAIHIWNYRKYEIENNTIEGYYDGIKIMQCGYGTVDKIKVEENNISNCSHSGITAYGSRGIINDNHISNNMYGIWLGDHCSFRVAGNMNALNNSQTQEIMDNSSYELTSTTFSFPYYFHLNRVIDEDNAGAPSDPLIYHKTPYNVQNDVRYNCWGTFFNPNSDFYPSGYNWQPEWCPPYMAYPDNGVPGAVYDSCQTLLANESYSQAESLYQSLINTHPQSVYSMAALHELFALENYLSSDFTSLKSYYQNNTAIQNDTILAKVAEHLALKCDIKEGNWSIAISYYDSIIAYPPSYEDSLFAVLNLNYVNFMMHNSGNKSGLTIMNSSYIKKDLSEFKPYCDKILALIPPPAEKTENQNSILFDDRCLILETVPNPASNFTRVKYQINEDADISLILYDNQGKGIKTVAAGRQTEGINFIKIGTSELQEGMYFYIILLNGVQSAKEKLIVVK